MVDYRLIHGDCLEVLPRLDAQSVHCVVTSPPYAEQRKKFYGGIPEAEYPAWTVAWMEQAARVVRPTGSVLINIREHVRNGQISDYVHKTRLALRTAGWCECDELIWIKPVSPPVGHPGRPRRSWERVLWFARANQPWCNPQANGKPSKRIGMHPSPNSMQWVSSARGSKSSGIARCQDYIAIGTGEDPTSFGHPAAYPVALAEWMIRLVCPPGGVVLDPFCGSGSTGVAALNTGRSFVGIELNADYIQLAETRLNGQPMRLVV